MNPSLRGASGRRRIFFELLEVAVFELLHESFALEEVALEVSGKLAGDDEKLVVDDFGERDGAARGDEVGAPLEHEAGVPEGGDDEKGDGGGESGALGAEELGSAFEENGEAEDEKRSERNEKAVAVRGDAGPIGVAGDEKVESEKGGEKGSAGAALPAPENKKAGDGEEKNGCPGEQAVVGGKEHFEKNGGRPQPMPERNVAGFERAAVNNVAGDESGEQADEEDDGEERMSEKKFGDAWSGIGSGGFGWAKGEVILADDFDSEDGEDHGVGVVDVEHEAGDQGEDHPLREGARGARLVPIPEEKCNDESGMGVGPGWIEVHVDGERAGPPDRERSEECPALFNVLARETEGEEQAEKSVEGGGESHGDAVRRGETVGGDGGAKGAREKYAEVGEKKKRRPKNSGADGEVIFEVTGGRAVLGFRLVIFVDAGAAEAFVGELIVPGEIEIVLD